MGFNPYRKHQVSAVDIGLLAAALLLAIGLVVWGFFG